MTARPSGNLLALTCHPDAHHLLKFRRLLETHQLTERIFETINALTAKGLMSKEGTVVDATIICAVFEMHQTKKAINGTSA